MNTSEYSNLVGKRVIITVRQFGKVSQHVGTLGLDCGNFVRLIHHKVVPSYIKKEHGTVYTYYDENAVLDIKLFE